MFKQPRGYFLGLLLAMPAGWSHICRAQVDQASPQSEQPTRTFIFEDKQSNDPVQLVGFRVRGTMVGSGQSFRASDEDWLQDSTMVLQNVSKRVVVAATIMLFFPESGGVDQPTVADQVSLGTPPPEGRYTSGGKKLDYTDGASLSVAPGQYLEIPLGQHFAGFKGLIEQHKALKDVTTCRVRFAVIYFNNGMKWDPNYFGRPDPDRPGQYLRILPSEFYEYHPAPRNP